MVSGSSRRIITWVLMTSLCYVLMTHHGVHGVKDTPRSLDLLFEDHVPSSRDQSSKRNEHPHMNNLVFGKRGALQLRQQQLLGAESRGAEGEATVRLREPCLGELDLSPVRNFCEEIVTYCTGNGIVTK